MHVDPVHPTAGDEIPQPLQSGPDQRRATVPVIEELVVGGQAVPISGDPVAHRRDLAGNRVGGRLLLRGDPRVGRDYPVAHARLLPDRRSGAGAWESLPGSVADSVR
jgi:hypothetical protein